MRAASLGVFCALSLVTLVSEAGALGLRWASGETDLRFKESRRCTLLVCASEATGLPTAWRLAYAVDGMDERIQFRPDYCDPGTAGICWAPGEELTPADRVSRKQTVQHCNFYTTARAQCARYLFSLPTDARATFRVMAVSSPESPDAPGGLLEVTTNGGASDGCPPTVTV